MHIRCRPSLGTCLQLALSILLSVRIENVAAQGRSLQALKLPEGFHMPNIFNTCKWRFNSTIIANSMHRKPKKTAFVLSVRLGVQQPHFVCVLHFPAQPAIFCHLSFPGSLWSP